MPLYTTDALVLRTYPLGETDRIVVALTCDRGKKRGVARGARRSRRRFGGALEPLTRVRLAYVEREHRELVSFDYAEPVQSPMSAADPDGAGHAVYFAELIDEWAPQNHANERLFRLGTAALGALVAGVPAAALARYFEYWLLRLEGVYPALVRCAACGRPLSGGGGVIGPAADALLCLSCAPRSEADLSPAALAFLRTAGAQAPDALRETAVTAGTLRELASVHAALLARHLDREPRSLRVLRALEAASLPRGVVESPPRALTLP